ncbi:MarR family winged helix-turn-helix transcriptional regulator [Nakamurella lactea]|uniref:MarR family winged helix-turn-helix transcriptional regulator n=1 Tax=Nakamurella lactea TaxID=459515 RepID=UPI000420F39A|nr:MarR family winged helix-turn-helix transcriptional regulator [Nakamurella lactea]
MAGTSTPQTRASVDFGLALGALMRRYHSGATQAVAELPGGPRGFQVLAISAAGGCESQAQIAERLGLDRTVMTYLVDDLEKADLVVRRPDPVDRRARQILLTANGRKAFDAATRRLQHVEREVLGELTAAEARQFRELLQRIVASTPPDHAPDCSVPDPCAG